MPPFLIMMCTIMKEKVRYLYPPFPLTASYCYLPSFLVLKDILECDSKSSCSLEGEGDGWHLFPLLKRDNGLLGYTNLSAGFRDGYSLVDVDLGFPQLVDDLFRGKVPSDHLFPFVVLLD